MTSEVFLRQVPAHLEAGLRNGSYRVYGSTIRNCSTGRIAGFLQPTAANSASLAVAPGIGAWGVAGLAVGALNLGIMVAGFAILARKIDQLRDTVHDVAGKLDAIDRKLDQIARDAIDVDFIELRALAKGMDEAWQLSDAQRASQQWHDLAQKALSLQTRFEWRADRLLSGDQPSFALAEPMLDAIVFANGLRVSALAACDEPAAAIEAAGDGARSIERLTGGIGLVDLVDQRADVADAVPGSVGWTLAYAEANEAERPALLKMRDREAATATRAASLVFLGQAGASIPALLAEARNERQVPFLLIESGEQSERPSL